MIIHLGADHGGFALKEFIRELLHQRGYEVADEGSVALDPADDFPVFAGKVAKAVSLDTEGARGILLCRSGAGVDIVANKFPGVRSVLALSPDQVFQSRRDDDVNVLSLAADHIDEEKAKQLVTVFLETPFEKADRRERRLRQITDIEEGISRGL